MVTRFQSANDSRISFCFTQSRRYWTQPHRREPRLHFDRWNHIETGDRPRLSIGQKKNVQSTSSSAWDTREKIDEMIERNRNWPQYVGAGEGWLTELSTAALKVVRLREGAVADSSAESLGVEHVKR